MICPGTSHDCQGFKKPEARFCCNCNRSRHAPPPSPLAPPPSRQELMNRCITCLDPTDQPRLCERCYAKARVCPGCNGEKGTDYSHCGSCAKALKCPKDNCNREKDKPGDQMCRACYTFEHCTCTCGRGKAPAYRTCTTCAHQKK